MHVYTLYSPGKTNSRQAEFFFILPLVLRETGGNWVIRPHLKVKNTVVHPSHQDLTPVSLGLD